MNPNLELRESTDLRPQFFGFFIDFTRNLKNFSKIFLSVLDQQRQIYLVNQNFQDRKTKDDNS